MVRLKVLVNYGMPTCSIDFLHRNGFYVAAVPRCKEHHDKESRTQRNHSQYMGWYHGIPWDTMVSNHMWENHIQERLFYDPEGFWADGQAGEVGISESHPGPKDWTIYLSCRRIDWPMWYPRGDRGRDSKCSFGAILLDYCWVWVATCTYQESQQYLVGQGDGFSSP